ncbi:MAG TPA: HAD family hydrolase [Vicinamibacterales bacterium]|nr:HAD family hydrolase [Vicinamibacterales bacterium]
MINRLVLYDIDGTLITTGRAGVRGMNAAFARLHGRDDALEGISFAGRTDRAIVTDIFQAMGIDAGDEQIEALRDAYLEHLREEIRKPVPDSGVLPGVVASLETFETRTDVGVGLLTGNFLRGAQIKLGHFGLWDRFRFGAFGDTHADRRKLVPVAIDEARRATGVSVPPGCVVVIGDTPLDVDCAHAHGAVAVGVATGPFSAHELAAAKADLVLESLGDVRALVDLVNGLA